MSSDPLNIIPEGKAAWLSYQQHLELKRLFETVPLPSTEEATDDLAYRWAFPSRPVEARPGIAP